MCIRVVKLGCLSSIWIIVCMLLWRRHLLDLLLRYGLLLLVVLYGCWRWLLLDLGLWLYLRRVGVDVIVVSSVAPPSPEEENNCEDDGTEEDNAADYSTCNGADWRALLLLLAVGLDGS